MKRVQKICDRENVSVSYMASNIGKYVLMYDKFGEQEEFGRKSHNAYISALKRFEEFSKS